MNVVSLTEFEAEYDSEKNGIYDPERNGFHNTWGESHKVGDGLSYDKPTRVRGSAVFLSKVYRIQAMRKAWGNTITDGYDHDVSKDRLLRRLWRWKRRGRYFDLEEVPALAMRGVGFDWVLFDSSPDPNYPWQVDEQRSAYEGDPDYEEWDIDVSDPRCAVILSSLLKSDANYIFSRVVALPPTTVLPATPPFNNYLRSKKTYHDYGNFRVWKELVGRPKSGQVEEVVGKLNRALQT